MSGCPYCSYDGDPDEVYVHALGEHRDVLPDEWQEILGALDWLEAIEPEAEVDTGRAEALAADLERWSSDSETYGDGREAETEAARAYGRSDAFDVAATEVRDRLLEPDDLEAELDEGDR